MHLLFRSQWAVFAALSAAQQVYIPGSNIANQSCPAVTAPAPIQPATTSFTYTLTETTRYAVPLPTATATPTYALPYSAVAARFNVSTTTYGNWVPGAAAPTDTADRYGQAAWSAQWADSGLANFTRGLYSTTVAPTPIPTAELVYPPPRYFQPPDDCHPLPADFILGVAAAAAQVEGAVADEGRAPALPDFIPQFTPGTTANDFTANEHYYLYKQDIDRLAAIGVEYYSFSIAWTRILPFAYPGTPVNQAGIQHYSDLIDYVLSKGMKPMATLLHTDPPIALFGNYTQVNAERSYLGYGNVGYAIAGFQDAYVNYGQIVMSHFADRVPIWITYNEPQTGVINGVAIYNVIKSHARLHHFYREVLNGTGRITMKMGGTPGVPLDPTNATHVETTQRYNDFTLGPYLYTLALGQDYPEVYKQTIQDYVPLSTTDLAYMNNTMDFIAFDGYTVVVITPVVSDPAACAANNATSNPYYPTCASATDITRNGWAIGENPDYFIFNAERYVRTQIGWFWQTFAKPVFISEFGVSTSSALSQVPQISSFDLQRSDYYLAYLSEISKAIYEDGVDFVGVLMWSWVDNWEWGTYSHQLGIQGNNFTTQERFYRRSAFDVVDFVATSKGKN